jgi:hypothetical protein
MALTQIALLGNFFQLLSNSTGKIVCFRWTSFCSPLPTRFKDPFLSTEKESLYFTVEELDEVPSYVLQQRALVSAHIEFAMTNVTTYFPFGLPQIVVAYVGLHIDFSKEKLVPMKTNSAAEAKRMADARVALLAHLT